MFTGETILYALTLFFFLMGAYLISLSRAPRNPESNMIGVSTFIFMFGVAYLALAHLTMLVALTNGADQYGNPSCEWLTNQTTLNTTTNTTTYTYTNPCDGYQNNALVAILTGYTWFLWIASVAVFVAPLFLYVLGWIGRW